MTAASARHTRMLVTEHDGTRTIIGNPRQEGDRLLGEVRLAGPDIWVVTSIPLADVKSTRYVSPSRWTGRVTRAGAKRRNRARR